MKPKNFPGRKNIRRINAISRMKIKHHIEQTQAKIINQEEAEAIRTKKYRA